MAIPSETIALPVVKGLDLSTDARLVQPPTLLEAENTQFSGGGAKKRRGHQAFLARTQDDLTSSFITSGGSFVGAGDIYGWHFGMGLVDKDRVSGTQDTRLWTDTNPELSKVYGTASRDDETLVWDGFRLVSYLPSQGDSQAPRASVVNGSAVMPSLIAPIVGKANEHQLYPEIADNGVTRIVTWITGASQKYAIYDSVSDALVASGTFAVVTPVYARAFTLGNWMHVAVRSGDDTKITLFSIASSEPNDITVRSYGECTQFDLWKVSESEAVLARSTVDGIYVTWINTIGTGSSSHTPFLFTPASGTAGLVTIGFNQWRLGLSWYDGTNIGSAILDHNGTLEIESSFAASGVVRLTHAPKYSQNALNYTLWDIYWDNGTHVFSKRFWYTYPSMVYGTTLTRHNKRLVSRAWNIEDRSFIWVGHQSTAQSTWFLLDESLLPVGHLGFGVADVSGLSGTAARLCGVNWLGSYEVQMALSTKIRVENDTTNTSHIYTEPTIRGVELNFLPTLRGVQAGRCTYFPGAQLWAYDGHELVEAGFHLGPEPTLAQSSGGALTADGTYSYRVDLCHRNAQNEEVRSLSILSNSVVLSGANQTITLTIPTVLTRREDSYFLIFRNAMSSGVPLTEWWLVNSRDPNDASYLPNDLTTATVAYIDDGSVNDTAIQTRELHPATDTYLQPVAAPACEIIASGRDRLWVGGGELLPGVVAPSRLFDPGEVPSFNSYLELQVDRSVQPLTALGFIGEIAVFFRREATHILDSDGPDNVAQGLWNPPRLALADVGAVSQEGLARISQGIIFQSLTGFRLMGPGGALSPIGIDIDRVAKTFSVVGTVVNERDQEVRFYGSASDGTYVFNYLYGTWAHWSCGGVGVAKNSSGYAMIARDDGVLWIETPGVWKDGGSTYTHRIRTAWLHGANIGDFQRVRRVSGLGRFADLTNPAHELRLELFYDEREFWEERVEWTLPDTTTNQDTWGAATWGAGVWGDTSATISNLEDLEWEWVRRPSRQKCSVFSIALEDVNTDGPGFELAGFGLELARKHGLDRVPERTGTHTTR